MALPVFQTIRPANVAVLVKLETTTGTDAVPAAAVDAIPVEADSVNYNSPWTNEQSNEATGSLVAGAPLIVGQAAQITFRSRIKGAGAGSVYSSTVKPPLHQALQACGWRGQFTAAITAIAATAGSATSATLTDDFPDEAGGLLGMPLVISAGVGNGAVPFVSNYTAGRVATLTDSFDTPLDTTSVVGVPANWTYAGTSPSSAADRLTDQPSATIYIYEDGTLLKFVGCRGVMSADGKNAHPGYAAFTFSGIYAGTTDVAMPDDLVIANHSAPVLAQGSAKSGAALANRLPLSLDTWSMDAGSTIDVPDDPNTPYGFGAGEIVDRVPVLSVNPKKTLVANRDTISQIGAGTVMPAILRHGAVVGNAWALVAPRAQPTDAAPGTAGKLRTEEIKMQLLSSGKDAYGRDSDRYLTFY